MEEEPVELVRCAPQFSTPSLKRGPHLFSLSSQHPGAQLGVGDLPANLGQLGAGALRANVAPFGQLLLFAAFGTNVVEVQEEPAELVHLAPELRAPSLEPGVFALGYESRKIAYFWVVRKFKVLVYRSGRFGLLPAAA